MFCLVASVLLAGQDSWPAMPIQLDFDRGAKVSKIRKGVDRVIGLDRVVIGKWTDGIRSKDVEEVVLMTPSLMSRWLGWLAQRESLSAVQISERWEGMQAAFGTVPTVIVRLALYERNDALELADISRPNLTELESVSFRWVPNGGSSETPTLANQLMFDRWGTEPTKLNSIPWWASSEQWRLLWPTGHQTATWDGLQRGWNRLKVLSVKLPSDTGFNFETGGTLVVQKGSKTLKAVVPEMSHRVFRVPKK